VLNRCSYGPALRSAVVLLVLFLACGSLQGCSDDGGDDKDAATADAAIDVASDAGSDGGADAGGDAMDGGGCAVSCVDKNGIEDLSKCPVPQNEWACVQGCCEKKEVCKADADCAAKLGTVVCPDERFTCGCDLATGACFQSVCSDDAACPAGQICDSGGCHDKPAAASLSVWLLRDGWIARPGDAGEAVTLFGAQARGADGAVDPTAVFEWTLAGEGFELKDGKLTATAKAGKATITAALAGGKASNPATLWNLGPLPDGASVRVTLVDEETFAPLAGKVYALCGPADATPTTAEVALDGGQAVFEGLTPPCDLHAISPDYDAVSVMRYDVSGGSDVVLASRLRHFAKLAFDIDGKPVADDTSMLHGDVHGGVVTYSGQGEAGLGITSLGIGSDLLLFNLDAIIGPNVTRPFHPDAPSLVNPTPGAPQDIPGGVTFFLGKKVIESFVLAGPPGKRIVWSLSGRLPLSDLLSQVSAIVGAVQDGLDVGKVVGVLLPYLQGFYSQVVIDVAFEDKVGVVTPKALDLAPDVPLGVSSTIEAPDLPKTGEGKWADLILAIGGAMMPDGTMIPLGLAAGSDTSGEGDKADGKVDGDQEEDGNQPLALNTAPLHSGLRVGSDNRLIVTAAINVGGGGQREGGSIVFSKLGPIAGKHKPQAFLPYALGSTWDAAKRTLNVAKVDGAAFYRVVMTGSEGRRWSLLVPSSATGKPMALPDSTAWGVDAALANTPKRVFVGAFELHAGATDLWKALGSGVMVDLVRKTSRSSFIDVH
jgi:hypothetical protein